MSDLGAPAKPSKSRQTQPLTAGDPCHDVLVALRRIIRAIDIQSKRVSKASGLTPPQVLILQSIRDLGEVTTGRISAQVNLSQATVTTILDRLEHRGLIERYRSLKDRRVVHTRLTAIGGAALKRAPPLLHERFIETFLRLDEANQTRIIGTLEEIAEMLGAGGLDAAPLLDVQSPDAPE
jgi:DNA-binding MarR family transcriptional regulator